MSSIIKSAKSDETSYVIRQFVEETQCSSSPEKLMQKTETLPEIANEILEDAYKKRDLILLKAETQKKEAEELIEIQKQEWELEKEKIAKEASQIGYQEGYGEGKRAARLEYDVVLENLKKTLTLTKEQEEKILMEMEPQILEISLRIANKIMLQSIQDDPSCFTHIVKGTVREVKEENDIKIYIHPSFYEEVYKQKDELKTLLRSETLLTIFPDDTLEETQCIVESSYCRIEGGIDDQLQQIKKALLKCLEEV